jgi:hypothetical protein
MPSVMDPDPKGSEFLADPDPEQRQQNYQKHGKFYKFDHYLKVKLS